MALATIANLLNFVGKHRTVDRKIRSFAIYPTYNNYKQVKLLYDCVCYGGK